MDLPSSPNTVLVFGLDWNRAPGECGSSADRVCSLYYCSIVRVVSQKRRQRKGESCLLSWSLPWVAEGWLLVTGNARLAMRPERWVEYAADDLRGRVKFLHNRRARWTPAAPQPEQDAQREQLRWSHSPVFLLLLRNLSFQPCFFFGFTFQSLSFLNRWICSYFSTLFSSYLLLPLTRSLSPSLAYSQLFALPRSLILCEKRTQIFSAQQRGRIRHFFLNQGNYSCKYICCFMICVSQWDFYLNLCLKNPSN